jgi:hypothetical protein
MNRTTLAASAAAGLAGLVGVFYVGHVTANGTTTTTEVIASGTIQAGACLPPMNAIPDPCLSAAGTLENALQNLARSSYYVQWRKAYPSDLATLRLYAAHPGLTPPGVRTAFGAVIAGMIEAIGYAHGTSANLP